MMSQMSAIEAEITKLAFLHELDLILGEDMEKEAFKKQVGQFFKSLLGRGGQAAERTMPHIPAAGGTMPHIVPEQASQRISQIMRGQAPEQLARTRSVTGGVESGLFGAPEVAASQQAKMTGQQFAATVGAGQSPAQVRYLQQTAGGTVAVPPHQARIMAREAAERGLEDPAIRLNQLLSQGKITPAEAIQELRAASRARVAARTPSEAVFTAPQRGAQAAPPVFGRSGVEGGTSAGRKIRPLGPAKGPAPGMPTGEGGIVAAPGATPPPLPARGATPPPLPVRGVTPPPRRLAAEQVPAMGGVQETPVRDWLASRYPQAFGGGGFDLSRLGYSLS